MCSYLWGEEQGGRGVFKCCGHKMLVKIVSHEISDVIRYNAHRVDLHALCIIQNECSIADAN